MALRADSAEGVGRNSEEESNRTLVRSVFDFSNFRFSIFHFRVRVLGVNVDSGVDLRVTKFDKSCPT